MGSPPDEPRRSNNETQHQVKLTKGSYLGKYEVTQGQWEAVMGRNPSEFKNVGRDAPVEQVSWDDCQVFCRKLGVGFRLPTEAEWEYACRAGAKGPYAGDLDDMAWCGQNSGNTTHPVGLKKPNAWGLYDMHGNVAEWCHDWYGEYPVGAVTDPTGPEAGQFRRNRGGSWGWGTGLCRSADRNCGLPGHRIHFLGLRLAFFPPLDQR